MKAKKIRDAARQEIYRMYQKFIMDKIEGGSDNYLAYAEGKFDGARKIMFNLGILTHEEMNNIITKAMEDVYNVHEKKGI